MSAGTLKRVGIVCFVLSAVLLFVSLFAAFKGSQDKAAKVEAENEMMRSSSPSGMSAGMAGDAEPQSGIPATAIYSLVFAVIASVGGIVCFVRASKKGKKGKKGKPTAGSSRFLDSLRRSP